MIPTILNAPHTVFASVAAAQKIADAAGADDDFTYEVVADPKGSGKAIIKVYDENHAFVGNL